MTMNPDATDSIRVLVCLADADQGTELAHGLREQGLDVLVAHHIRSAMRVMEKESPQAVIVEVATKAYDGFRVAQWASGRVLAIFLVAGRQLTTMEDVEVLKAGAKEVFYTPLQAETIAASIRGACGPDTRDLPDGRPEEPKTRYHAPESIMEAHAANTVRAVSVIDPATLEPVDAEGEDIDPAAKTEAMAPVKLSDLDPTRANPLAEEMEPEHAATLMQAPYAQKPPVAEPLTADPTIQAMLPPNMGGPVPEEGPAPSDTTEENSAALVAELFEESLGGAVIDPSSVPGATIDYAAQHPLASDSMTSEPVETQTTSSTEAAEMVAPTRAPERDSDDSVTAAQQSSDALVDDLFGSPPEPAQRPLSSALSSAPRATEEPPKESKPEAPADDDFLMAGMMDDLDNLSSDAFAGDPRSAEVEEELEEPPTSQGEAPETSDDAEDLQGLATELAEGPLTSEVIAAAYGSSSTPKWIAQALMVAVIGAGAWLGMLGMERMAPSVETESQEAENQSEGDRDAGQVRDLLHATLGEAAIAHRDGDLDEARSIYKRALKADKDNAIALRGLAAVALQQEKWTAARDSLNRLGKIAPDDASLPLQQGLVLRELGKKQRARAEFLRFIDSTKADDPKRAPAAQVYLSLTAGP